MIEKEEAIYILNTIKDIIVYRDLSWTEDAKKVVNEAFDMAIEALKEKGGDSKNEGK